MSDLTNKESLVLYELSRDSQDHTQRSLAEKTQSSLGMINMILRRLIQQGHVKTRRINRKNIRYLLTPKGAHHNVRRTYQAIARTIRYYRILQKVTCGLAAAYLDKGYFDFYVHGQGEISQTVTQILEIFCAGSKRARLVNGKGLEGANIVIFNTTAGACPRSGVRVDLHDHLPNFI